MLRFPLLRFLLARFLFVLFFCVVVQVFPRTTAMATTWAVYCYFCGSDLETRLGAASDDINEILRAKLGKNVTVVIETGGAKQWRNKTISNKHIERYEVQSGKLKLVQRLKQASMGEASTLADFVSFCLKNYDADHKVLIIWDHGGGSVYGFAHDEIYDQSLNLQKLRKALTSAVAADEIDPPFEIIGFDACLMATFDTAYAVRGFTNYLVASQEVEPKIGWEYTGFLSALGAKPSMDAEDLGTKICDTYMRACEKNDRGATATLSVIDVECLTFATNFWNILGLDVLDKVRQHRSYYGTLSRYATSSENYYNDIKAKSFTNMVDIGQFTKRLQRDFGTSANFFAAALDDAIVYKVNGTYRKGSGLSFYYPLDGGKSLKTMLEYEDTTTFLVLHALMKGAMNKTKAIAALEHVEKSLEENKDDILDFIKSEQKAEQEAEQDKDEDSDEDLGEQEEQHPQASTLSPSSLSSTLAQTAHNITEMSVTAMNPLDDASLQDLLKNLATAPVDINKKGEAILKVDKKYLQYISYITAFVCKFDEENGDILYLGHDVNLRTNWKDGVFIDAFNGKWPSLDGHFLHVQSLVIGKKYYSYSIPIKLNGELGVLEIAYDRAKKDYVILGVKSLLPNGLPDKNIRKLKEGDKITTRTRYSNVKKKGDVESDYETFTFSSNSKIVDKNVENGLYVYMFNLTDVNNNSISTDAVFIDVEDGKITKEQM